MFDKSYRFRGRHAEEVDRLTGIFEQNSKAKLFEKNVDIYINAPLIGFLYGRMSDIDDTKNPQTGKVYEQSIFDEQVIRYSEELIFNFRLIILLDTHYEPDPDKRINKAFRHLGEDTEDEKRFDSYVRGGVDVLYEKVIENSTTPDDFVNHLYDFVEEFQERFNEEVTGEDLVTLCRK